MFRKRTKKVFPEGTFIPKPSRIASILHLSIAFTVLLGVILSPFLQDLFVYKSHTLLFDHVMGKTNSNPILERNFERFSKLPFSIQQNVLDSYTQIKNEFPLTFLEKAQKSLRLIKSLSLYTTLWILLSIIIPILILKKREGAEKAAYLLPLMVLLLLLSYPTVTKVQPSLYPSEEKIIKEFLKEPLSSDISIQYEQLSKGWKLYLIKEWSQKTPSQNPSEFEMQVEEGDFLFHLNFLLQSKPSSSSSILLYYLLFFWSLFYVYIVNRYHYKKVAFILPNVI